MTALNPWKFARIVMVLGAFSIFAMGGHRLGGMESDSDSGGGCSMMHQE